MSRVTANRTASTGKANGATLGGHKLGATLSEYVATARAARGSYPSAYDVRQRHPENPGSADWHLDPWERWRLVNKSRATERENEWYDAVLGNFADLVVGSHGPEPLWIGESLTPEVTEAIQRAWRKDARKKRLDVSKQHSWASLLKLRVRSIVRDGDVLVWHDGKGRTLHYESDQLGKVYAQQPSGIETSYELNGDDPMRLGRPDAGGGAVIDADSAHFIAWRTRFGQTRGAPVLQSSLTRWQRLSSLTEAEIISAEMSATVWTTLETETGVSGFEPPVNIDPETGEEITTGAVDDGSLEGWIESNAGNMMAPPRGVKATPWSPNRPNMDVPPFVKMMLRRFVAPLCPYEALFADFEGLSYATVRGLGQAARFKIGEWRDTLLEDSIDQQATDWLAALQASGRISALAGIDLENLRLEWRWEDLDIRDREKDAVTAEKEDGLGHQSMQDRLGNDWQRVQDQRHEEAMRQAELDHRLEQRITELAAERNGMRPSEVTP